WRPARRGDPPPDGRARRAHPSRRCRGARGGGDELASNRGANGRGLPQIDSRAHAREGPRMIPVSIGITTRDRAASLGRCLASIAAVLGAGHDVMVFDDGSDVPATRQVEQGELGLTIRFLRDERRPGYIVGRNEMVRQARHPFVLLLDDDTVVLDAAALDSAVAVLAGDPSIGAIAFAQAEADGRPWPERMQPGRGNAPCYVASFIGFAHLLC